MDNTSSQVPSKVGLYTSPHLRFVRERIRFNGAPISEEDFASSFFEIWDILERTNENTSSGLPEPEKPAYFRYLTLMAFHSFLKEKVDTAIIECGIGGEFDSTNILESPTVTGITSLGLDHTALLGSRMGEIAWHKAGIMKEGVPALTVPQPKEALDVLEFRATQKGVDLRVVDVHPQIASGEAELGLSADFQKVNASLAVELAATHLEAIGHSKISTDSLPDEFLRGLKEVEWAGRCETRREANMTMHIDSAHTVESMQLAAEWFASCVTTRSGVSASSQAPRILLFNQQTRAGLPLLRTIYDRVSVSLEESVPFTHAIFCSNLTFIESGYRPDLVNINANEGEVKKLEVQQHLADSWRLINPVDRTREGKPEIKVVQTIEQAVRSCQDVGERWKRQVGNAHADADPVRVFVTGSVHTVGGVLEVLESGRLT